MNENLLNPSLKGDDFHETKSYDIGRLFYVSFFGGIIPTIALGIRNARWLKIDKKIINLMIILGIVILILKVITVSWFFSNLQIPSIRDNAKNFRLAFRILSVILFLIYYKIMKSKFKQHILSVGKIEPLLKEGIIWSILGIVIEFIIIAIGGFLI